MDNDIIQSYQYNWDSLNKSVKESSVLSDVKVFLFYQTKVCQISRGILILKLYSYWKTGLQWNLEVLAVN